MKDKSRARFNDNFPPQHLAAIAAGFKEVGQEKIEYKHPFYLIDKLEMLWKPRWEEPLAIHADAEVLGTTPSVAPGLPHVESSRESAKWLAGMTDQFIKDIQYIDRKLQGRILQAITRDWVSGLHFLLITLLPSFAEEFFP